MALHLYCNTPYATVLIAVPVNEAPLKFPNDASFWPGIGFKVDPLLSINDQILLAIHKVLPSSGLKVHIWQEYSDLLQREGVMDSTLYVARIDEPGSQQLDQPKPSFGETQTWSTLPDLIRTLPKDRNRLAYLKAWQVLSGALEENTKALDVAEVVKHLKSLEKETNS
ncbi:MAG: hypothetical protein NT027_14780 [Proteobacteria bacterium]|nr:hypothetical protein [Pseudomonadota bacterium]